MSTTPGPIPQPPRRPLIGNLLDIDRRAPFQSLGRLARAYGPIFRMDLPGRSVVVLSGRDLVDEVCDERRFDKLIGAGLKKVRAFTGDGLFTAGTGEPNWRKAHQILLPNFGPGAMQGYLPLMVEIADELIAKWGRLNPDEAVDVADDMTRLTLDTIGLCGFDYRFHSFYRERPHPFVRAMIGALGEALLQSNRPAPLEAVQFAAHRRQARDIAHMNELVDRLVRERRADPAALATKRDLLNHMLTGSDGQTGERLDDLNIRHQIITFLIAGHETTSGLLSFAIYYLMKHPGAMARAREEVDRVLDPDPASPPTLAQVRRLAYLGQVLKESLRLWPTAPAFSLMAREGTTLGGRYALQAGANLLVLLPMLHRDPSSWGADAEAFDPDRFAPDRERQLPPNAYKPFGNGRRACIGQQFAMQEATLVLGMVLRRFDLLDHADYRLRVKETLTIKPEGLTIKVRARARRAVPVPVPAPAVPAPTPAPIAAKASEVGTPRAGGGTPLLVLYGSNLGTAEGVARRIAEDGRALGFAAHAAPLDDHVGRLPGEGALVVIASSYNGAPPDNAARCVDWLRGDPGAGAGSLGAVRYAVFGCGDRNWAATYQAVPREIDERLAARGASRICPRGEGDAADDFDGQFRAWYAPFWGQVARSLGLAIREAPPEPRPGLRVEPVVAAAPPFAASFGARPMAVVARRELQSGPAPGPPARSTLHIELALPEGVTYRAGDHLGILPRNRPGAVARALGRFRLDGENRVILRREGDRGGASHLPINVPIRLADLLADHVELQDTATRGQIAALAGRTPCPPEKARLLALAAPDGGGGGGYRAEVLAGHASVLDLLERSPSCEVPFEEFLAMLPPLRPRYYSISSSPLVADRVVSITVAVVAGPARSGRGRYEGVASNYLADLTVEGRALGFVRPPGSPFRPPVDPATPMIMVGAGTGVAPFRGFLQEREAWQDRGLAVGPSLLFFGCRDPGLDFLYEPELRRFEAKGVTRLVPAFSRVAGRPKCYAQHNIAALGDEAWDLIGRGAMIYVCGDAATLAPDVLRAFAELHRAKVGTDGVPAEAWLATMRADGRYLEDVWASG